MINHKVKKLKILLFLAKGVELIEASAFIDVFGWHRQYNKEDIEVVTCGVKREIISTFGIPLKADLLIDEVAEEDFAALVIPGGFGEYGFYEDAYDERLLELIRRFNDAEKMIASVCVGSFPLGKSGVLRGRRGTTYHLINGRKQKQLAELGVNIVVDEPVVIDGNIISSWCPSTAIEVAFKLLEILSTKEDAARVRELMGY